MMKQKTSMFVSLLLLSLLLVAVSALDAESFGEWMQEDGWSEWSTVFAFLGAAALNLLALRQSSSAWIWLRLGTAAFCFFVAGEELSWGQRLVGFEPPEIFLESNFQQEANLHNLLNHKTLFGIPLDSRFMVALIALIYGVVGPLTRFRFEKSKPWMNDIMPATTWIPFYLAIATVELNYPVDLAGEACELMLGLLFLVDSMEATTGALSPRLEGTLVSAVLVLGILAGPFTQAVVFGSDGTRTHLTQEELKALASDYFAASKEARVDLNKSYIHKRLYSTVQSGYLRFENTSTFLQGKRTPAEECPTNCLRDRKGYFLDPWNNPYWFTWSEKNQEAALYSFGPNRKRDSTGFGRKSRPQPAGDDVFVRLSQQTQTTE